MYDSLAFFESWNIQFFTDISGDWIPKDVDIEGDGSHNGRNYIAYTFYAENWGQETINYNAEIIIDDVIRNVDDCHLVVDKLHKLKKQKKFRNTN